MADYGLKIKNINSEIQIDSVNRNYVFSEGADGQAIGASGGINNHNLTNPTPYPPIVMFRPVAAGTISPATNRLGLLTLTYSAPNYTAFQTIGLANATYDYRVFTIKDTRLGTDDYGLRIKNASGNLVYDSGFKTFRIINVISTSNGSTVAHGATNPYYIITPTHSGILGGHPAYTFRLVQGIHKVDSSNFYINLFLGGRIGGPTIGGSVSGTSISVVVCEYDD